MSIAQVEVSSQVEVASQVENEVVKFPAPAKFTIDRKQLADALARLDAVVMHRCHKATLQNVKISVNGHCQLLATDLDSSAVETLNCDHAGETVALANAKQFRKLVTNSKAKIVEVEICENGKLRVGAASMALANSEELEQFPPTSVEENKANPRHAVAKWHGSADTLLAMLEFCQVAVDLDSTRYALGGILIEFGQFLDELQLVATDGRRLHHCKTHNFATSTIDSNGAPTDRQPASFLLPAIVAKRIAKALPKAHNVSLELVQFSGDIVGLLQLQVSIFGKTSDKPFVEFCTVAIDGRYPNWRQVIPAEYENRFRVLPEQFAAIASQAAANVKGRDEYLGADFTFSFNKVAIDYKQSDLEFQLSADAWLCNAGDDELRESARLDCEFVRDFVSPACKHNGGADVEVEFQLAEFSKVDGQPFAKPIKFRTSSSKLEFTGVIMPMAK